MIAYTYAESWEGDLFMPQFLTYRTMFPLSLTNRYDLLTL